MRASTGRLVAAVAAVAALQDRVVREYLEPHAVRFAYWSLAVVYVYLGAQKLAPHRSAVDVNLSTVGLFLGVPYVPFITFVGAWQVVIGLLFLARRLRLCAVFFFSFQVFMFSTLVGLRYVAFQPPWITVLGVDVQWALGAYAALVLKNLVFAALFFVLAAIEFGADSPAEGSRT